MKIEKILEYTHIELNEDIKTISGYFTLEKEGRLEYNNKDVLYVVGHSMVDSSCCGVSGCRYALIPGYIVTWKKQKNNKGLLTSEVEPISDQDIKKKISLIIREKEAVTQIQFW